MIKLVLKNITEKPSRTILAGLSILIATTALTIFLSLENGIKNSTFTELEKKSPLTQITVRPNIEKTGIISFLGKSDKDKLTNDSIKQIQKIDGIKNIYPEIQFNNFASLKASVFGFSFETDAMLFGVPYEFIKEDIKSHEQWNRNTITYPTIIPTKLLDLYNVALASPQGLPLLSQNDLIGKEITLYPNYSTFFPGMNTKKDEIKLEVVGFSDKANLLGITLPYEVIENLNQKYSPNTQNQIVELFVEVTDASLTKKTAEEIEKLGLSTQYFQKNLKEVEAKISYLSISLGAINFIILLTTAIAIISTFLTIISERKKEIGLLRAIGATKLHIKKIILEEAFIIALISSTLGGIIGTLICKLINQTDFKLLQQITLISDDLFKITFHIFLKGIIFGIILTLISVYLPAHKAANLSPVEALKK